MYGDKMSMAVSLEARVPFLDLELMSFVESIPAHLKIHGRTQKYLLKKAVARWLPSEIVQRRKIGFATPVDQWFGTELHNFISNRLLDSNSACSRYFNLSTIKTLIEDHGSKRHDYKRHLFSLLTFELWHEQFIH
jgi:asparagine synthase (glutamine-hydrolysing)